MIIGSGCDILYIHRVESLVRHSNFLDKYFTNNEISMFTYYKKNNRNYVKKIASNICVKEAFFKSISHIISDFSFKDIEVLRDSEGRPYINLVNNLHQYLDGLNIYVTISNEKDIVISFVLLERAL